MSRHIPTHGLKAEASGPQLEVHVSNTTNNAPLIPASPAHPSLEPAPARTFGDAVVTCLGKYAVFSGRASRSEFWYFVLAATLTNVSVAIVAPLAVPEDLELAALISLVVSLVLIMPVIAASVRRLHDTGRSGWWYLLSVIPIANIALLVLLADPPAPGVPSTAALLSSPVEAPGTTTPPAATRPDAAWASPRPSTGVLVALWLAVGVLVLSNMAAWVMVATLWQERADVQTTTGGESVASELQAAERRIDQLETKLDENRFGGDLTALRVQTFVDCVNTYMKIVGDSAGGPYRYNFCR